MAAGDLMRQLFSAYARNDDATFRQVAAQIIAAERDRNHQSLAADLERELGYGTNAGGRPAPTLRPVPRGRDDRPLLRLVKAARTFDELVIPHEAHEVLSSIVEENLRRGLLLGHGLQPRHRLLFLGPPGTGKSVSAQAIAAELSLPVAVASLAALTSSFLGETARNIEAVIRFAEQTPCVLLFDEFDVLGQERSSAGDHGELRRVAATVLQLLEDMRCESLVIATSNLPELLDSAIWRRFDEIVSFGRLHGDQIVELVELRLRSMHRAFAVAGWTSRLDEFSPAEIELICYDALRTTVLSDTDTVIEPVFAASVERMRARKASIG
jgi:SpoVK/Ycf46/Vps4 family AAA+-type ATPase